MLALVLAIPFTYGLLAPAAATFDVTVAFDGFLPLLGGRTAKVEVKMRVDVKGLDPEPSGLLRAVSEIADFSLAIDGSKFPGIGVDSVREYFPKTTVSLSPQGKVLKTDAPDTRLPFRLPGLDVKRFPDITYLPIEFPEAGIEVGRPFEFKKRFGDSDVTYAVTPKSMNDDQAILDVKLAQTYTVLEDSGGNLVTVEADAVRRVRTSLTGTGTVACDRKRGLASKVEIRAESIGKVTELREKGESERRLKTTLTVLLKSPSP